MLATFPAGLLVLAIGWGTVGQQSIPSNIALSIAGILLLSGAAIALIYSPVWAAVISTVEVPVAMVPLIRELPDQPPA